MVKIMNNESTITNKKDKRNYGIDLLKIIAMIYVVVLHTLGNGGILRNLEPGTHKYFVAWFLETFAFCAVDIFALVTGYISYREEERKNLFLNYTKLWIQVVFYCTILSIIFNIFNIFNISVVRKETYIHNFLPVLTNQYWYFTAYTGVVILMPLLDEALRKLSNEKLKKIFILILIFFTASSIIKDNFGMSGGYTVIWLAVLYILGGIIKKCKIFNEIKSKYIVIAMIILFLSTYFYLY